MELNEFKECLIEWQETNMPQGVNIVIQNGNNLVSFPTISSLVEAIEQGYIAPLVDQLNQANEVIQTTKLENEEIRKRYKRAMKSLLETTGRSLFYKGQPLTVETIDKLFMDDSMFDEKGCLKNG